MSNMQLKSAIAATIEQKIANEISQKFKNQFLKKMLRVVKFPGFTSFDICYAGYEHTCEKYNYFNDENGIFNDFKLEIVSKSNTAYFTQYFTKTSVYMQLDAKLRATVPGSAEFYDVCTKFDRLLNADKIAPIKEALLRLRIYYTTNDKKHIAFVAPPQWGKTEFMGAFPLLGNLLFSNLGFTDVRLFTICTTRIIPFTQSAQAFDDLHSLLAPMNFANKPRTGNGFDSVGDVARGLHHKLTRISPYFKRNHISKMWDLLSFNNQPLFTPCFVIDENDEGNQIGSQLHTMLQKFGPEMQIHVSATNHSGNSGAFHEIIVEAESGYTGLYAGTQYTVMSINDLADLCGYAGVKTMTKYPCSCSLAIALEYLLFHGLPKSSNYPLINGLVRNGGKGIVIRTVTNEGPLGSAEIVKSLLKPNGFFQNLLIGRKVTIIPMYGEHLRNLAKNGEDENTILNYVEKLTAGSDDPYILVICAAGQRAVNFSALGNIWLDFGNVGDDTAMVQGVFGRASGYKVNNNLSPVVFASNEAVENVREMRRKLLANPRLRAPVGRDPKRCTRVDKAPPSTAEVRIRMDENVFIPFRDLLESLYSPMVDVKSVDPIAKISTIELKPTNELKNYNKKIVMVEDEMNQNGVKFRTVPYCNPKLLKLNDLIMAVEKWWFDTYGVKIDLLKPNFKAPANSGEKEFSKSSNGYIELRSGDADRGSNVRANTKAGRSIPTNSKTLRSPNVKTSVSGRPDLRLIQVLHKRIKEDGKTYTADTIPTQIYEMIFPVAGKVSKNRMKALNASGALLCNKKTIAYVTTHTHHDHEMLDEAEKI